MFDQHSSLRHHCLLSSGGFGEVKDRVSHYLWPHQMKMQQGGALQSQLYGVFFGSSALFELHYGAPMEIDAGDISDYYLIRVTLEGSGMVSLGKQSAILRKGRLTISSPSERSSIRIDKDCRNLILRVDRQALERLLQVLLNRRLRQPLVFDIQVDAEHQGMATVRTTLDYICQLYGDTRQSLLISTMGVSLSDYLLSVLLTQLPHNYSVDLLQDQRQQWPTTSRRPVTTSNSTWPNRLRWRAWRSSATCRSAPCKMASRAFFIKPPATMSAHVGWRWFT